jgi:predicted enzyme related to lactoylglutathione lyase
MLEGLRTVVYRVADLPQAKAWYAEMLNQRPYFDEPFYVGFNVGGYELGLLPTETEEIGSTTYWGVPEADAAYARLLELGAKNHAPIQDVGDGIRLGTVLDPLGNILGVIENPHFTLDPK